MSPYPYVYAATMDGQRLLSLCCGIGLELAGLETEHVTAVDIAPQYLEQVKQRCPQAETICDDALHFLKISPGRHYDVISIIDGIEHMDKRTGKLVIKHMKRVAREKVLLFTPQSDRDNGYLKNEPHNAWGIEGADEHQVHKSGWTREELESIGFKLVASERSTSQHDEPYTALMMEYECSR